MQIPRVELAEMGPSLDLTLRRLQPAGPDLQREAMKQPKLTKKKVRRWDATSEVPLGSRPDDGSITLEISSPSCPGRGGDSSPAGHLPEGNGPLVDGVCRPSSAVMISSYF